MRVEGVCHLLEAQADGEDQYWGDPGFLMPSIRDPGIRGQELQEAL